MSDVKLTTYRVLIAHKCYAYPVKSKLVDAGVMLIPSITNAIDEQASQRVVRWAKIFYGVKMLYTSTIGYHVRHEHKLPQYGTPEYKDCLLRDGLEEFYKIEAYNKIRAFALGTHQNYEEHDTFQFLADVFGLDFAEGGYRLKEPEAK